MSAIQMIHLTFSIEAGNILLIKVQPIYIENNLLLHNL